MCVCITEGQSLCPVGFGFHEVHAVMAVQPCCLLLVQVIAVAAGGPIVALAKLPDASACLHHHLLWHGHHNAKEVGILKCLKRSRTWTLRCIKETMRNFHFGLKLPSLKNMYRQ